MTMILNTATPSAASAPAQAAQQAGPVAAAQDAAPAGTSAASAAAGTAAPAANAANAAAPAAAANGTTNPAPAQAFAQWLGQQLDGAAQAAPAATLPAAPAQADTGASVTALAVTPVGGKTGTAAGTAAASDSDDGSKTAAAPDTGAMLAAMAMPLMPLSPQQITVALQAAAGSAPARADDGAARTAAAPVAASGDAGQRAALALPQLAALQQPVQAQAQVQVPAPGAAADATATRLAVQAANDGSVAANSGNSAGNSAGSNGGGNAGDGGADMAAVQTAPLANAAPVAAGAPVAASVQPAADTVKLAGPPTAWRQSLQEALGERLHVQVGNNIQQATISIEPPQLGRIDIAIRHSAGTLEVNISATNGDVLRQLQTVSDNLRSDLSQRQYTEVAVTVTPAPKNNAAPFGDPQQQGRGRQQERNQDNDPGRALAEAGTPASRFSLGGRES